MPPRACHLAMKICCCKGRTVFSARRGDQGFNCVNGLPHRQRAFRPYLRCVSFLFTPSAIVEFSSSGRRPKAGNIPRIPGVTPGLGLVHYPLSPATRRFALLEQSSGSAPRHRLPGAERRTTCPSSDGSTHGQDGSCSKDRRDFRSPWTTLMEGPTTREPEGSPVSTALRGYY
jgi:hypothetical protein